MPQTKKPAKVWKTPILTYVSAVVGYTSNYNTSGNWYFCAGELHVFFDLVYHYPPQIQLVARSQPMRGYKKLRLENAEVQVVGTNDYAILHGDTRYEMFKLGIIRDHGAIWMPNRMQKKIIYVKLVVRSKPAPRRRKTCP